MEHLHRRPLVHAFVATVSVFWYQTPRFSPSLIVCDPILYPIPFGVSPGSAANYLRPKPPTNVSPAIIYSLKNIGSFVKYHFVESATPNFRLQSSSTSSKSTLELWNSSSLIQFTTTLRSLTSNLEISGSAKFRQLNFVQKWYLVKVLVKVLFSLRNSASMAFRVDRPNLALPRVFREATLRCEGPITCLQCGGSVTQAPLPLLEEVNTMAREDEEQICVQSEQDRQKYCKDCHSMFRDNLYFEQRALSMIVRQSRPLKFNDMFHRNSGRLPPHGMSRADAIGQTVAEYSNMPVHIKHSTLILPIEFGKHYPGSLRHLRSWGTSISSLVADPLCLTVIYDVTLMVGPVQVRNDVSYRRFSYFKKLPMWMRRGRRPPVPRPLRVVIQRSTDAYQSTQMPRNSPLRRIADQISVPPQDVMSLNDSERMWLTGDVEGTWTEPASVPVYDDDRQYPGEVTDYTIIDNEHGSDDVDGIQTDKSDRDPSPLGPGDCIQMDLGQGRIVEIEVASVTRRQRPVPPSDEPQRAEPTDGYSILSPIDSNDDPAVPAPLDTEHLA